MIDRAGGEAVTHGQAGMTGPDDNRCRAHWLYQALRTSTVTLVGFVTMS